ncbi:MAG: hypothetical protein HGB26_07700 [Desulfobulbaceae bacterium]|nr:hypothetical protein [Desulfobulbaceae bacterium]
MMKQLIPDIANLEKILQYRDKRFRQISFYGERGKRATQNTNKRQQRFSRLRYLIIAGLSPDPDEADPSLKNEWSIWFWNGKTIQTESKLKKKWQKADLPAGIILNNPEAVSLIKEKNESAAQYLLLISDDGAEKPSSFVLIPLAKLE